MFNENILTHNNFKKQKKFPLTFVILFGIVVMSSLIVVNDSNLLNSLIENIRIFINS